MIAIICGTGNYPKLIAEACLKKGDAFCFLFVNDVTMPYDVPKLSIKFGEIEKMLAFFHDNKVDRVVFAGGITRPDFSKISLDKKGKSWLLKLGTAIVKGDDCLLRAVANLFKEEGFDVVAGTDLLDSLFLKKGVYSKVIPTESNWKDIELGIKSAKELGIQDLGQGVIVADGKVVLREDVEGTDRLIEKAHCAGGVLVKVIKPQQDTRFDVPAVGSNTIEKLHQYNFAGLAIEAEKCIVIDKEKMIELANKYNMFFVSYDTKKTKVFISAGEASGDYLGGMLMENLKKCANVEFFGIGGDNMANAGLKMLFPISELSIIGIWEVINKIFHVKKLINKTVDAIMQYQPDVVVTIDSSGFNHRVDKKLKSRGFKKPIIHYVAPPVWAWRKWRVKTMHKFIDKLLVLLPFEKNIFCKHKLNTVFVGHPIASDRDFDSPDDMHLANFQKAHKLNPDKDLIITILPGSRASELEQHIPVLRETVKILKSNHDNLRIIIPTLPGFKDEMRRITSDFAVEPIITTSKSEKILAYYSSNIAISASGTVALELARVGLPAITIYKTSNVTYHLVKFLIQVANVNLVNIIAEKEVVPELLQNDCTPDKIVNHLEMMLNNSDIIDTQKMYYADVIRQLTVDPLVGAREVLKSAK